MSLLYQLNSNLELCFALDICFPAHYQLPVFSSAVTIDLEGSVSWNTLDWSGWFYLCLWSFDHVPGMNGVLITWGKLDWFCLPIGWKCLNTCKASCASISTRDKNMDQEDRKCNGCWVAETNLSIRGAWSRILVWEPRPFVRLGGVGVDFYSQTPLLFLTVQLAQSQLDCIFASKFVSYVVGVHQAGPKDLNWLLTFPPCNSLLNSLQNLHWSLDVLPFVHCIGRAMAAWPVTKRQEDLSCCYILPILAFCSSIRDSYPQYIDKKNERRKKISKPDLGQSRLREETVIHPSPSLCWVPLVTVKANTLFLQRFFSVQICILRICVYPLKQC